MDFSYDLEDFSCLIHGIIFKADRTHSIINYAYFNGKRILNDATFDFFSEKINEIFNTQPKKTQVKALKYFIFEDDVEEKVISIKSDNDKITFYLRRKKTDDGDYFIIENISIKKELYDLIDPLTDVYQKASFISMVNKELKKEEPRDFYFCIIDIDNFKTINDSYGHKIGDEILTYVADILKMTFKNGAVGRYGGDEFISICFEPNDFESIWNILHKMGKDIRNISSKYEMPINISVTTGISRYKIDGKTFDELFVKADKALYRGKRKGKNCFVLYDEKLHGSITSRGTTMVSTASNAIGGQAFNLYNRIFYILENEVSKNTLTTVLECIASYFNADRFIAYLNINDHLELPFISYYKSKDEYGLEDGVTRDFTYWNMHMIKGFNKMVNVDNIASINPKLYQELNSTGIKSIMRSNLSYNGAVFGSLYLSVYALKRWSVDDEEVFKMITNILSLYLYNFKNGENNG